MVNVAPVVVLHSSGVGVPRQMASGKNYRHSPTRTRALKRVVNKPAIQCVLTRPTLRLPTKRLPPQFRASGSGEFCPRAAIDRWQDLKVGTGPTPVILITVALEMS